MNVVATIALSKAL